VFGGAYTFESGEAAAEALLALAPMPTAVFASNDQMAAGFLLGAHRRGLRRASRQFPQGLAAAVS